MTKKIRMMNNSECFTFLIATIIATATRRAWRQRSARSSLRPSGSCAFQLSLGLGWSSAGHAQAWKSRKLHWQRV